jgi:hypothetical protein
MNLSKKLAGLLLLGAMTATGHAVPTHYAIGAGSSILSNQLADAGLLIDTSLDDALSGTSFVLDDGESRTFKFFDIWTPEMSVNEGEDTNHLDFSATLDFTDPNLDAVVKGFTWGESFDFLGLPAEQGVLVWNAPASTFTLGDRSFELALSDATFNFGIFGLNEGRFLGGTVYATITQIPHKVPDSSATALLLVLAFAGLEVAGFLRPRRA